jgi:methylglutaconyl-CoA hydratase
MSGNEDLLVTLELGVATLTLNRLKQHNAFDSDLIKALQINIEHLATDPKVRLIKITANGKFFCAGGDLNWFKNADKLSHEENLADAATLAHLLRTLNELPKPTIAVVQGPAYGGGIGLIACCDISIAAETATFALSEVKLGLVPATIAPYMLRAIGSRQMRRYALTAESFNAQEALHMGLLHSVVKDENLKTSADNIARIILKNGPVAMETTKRFIQDLPPINPKEVEHSSALLAKIRISEEAQEGITAFFEKRDPHW